MGHIHELYDFTVSFYILHPSEAKLCLHYHRKLKCWNQLGGHIELNENPLETLERELLEEAGLQPSQYEILSTSEGPVSKNVKLLPMPFALPLYHYGKNSLHQHIDLPYIIQSKTTELVPASDESQEIGWFSLEQIKDMHSDGIVETSTMDICEWIFNFTQ